MDEGNGKPAGAPFPKLSRRSLLIGAGGVSISPAILKAGVTGSKAKVAVIGAGVFGSWTAEHLRRAGHQVTLVDMAGPANSRASSGGESRMTRGGYGKDEIYTRMAFASLPEWRARSDPAGLPMEVFYGPHLEKVKPFISPRGVEFETGENGSMGFGHMVVAVRTVPSGSRSRNIT